MSLSDRALLVSFNIRQWSARKLDRKETQAVAYRHGISESAVSTYKSLLPSSPELRAVHLSNSMARTAFYKMTLPWWHGIGIVKADAYLSVAERLGKLKVESENNAQAFLSSYSELREDAKLFLNDLYREEDYPPPEALARKFGVEVSFYPVPDPGDCSRVKVLSDLTNDMANDLAAKIARTEIAATQDAWSRIYEIVRTTHERLSNLDSRLHESLINNAVELCAVLPSLNISDDPALERMRQEVEKTLCTANIENLRKVPEIRKDVADKMKDIMDKMGAFYSEAA